MTRRIGKSVVLLEPEDPVACGQCGTVRECRPYGPEGSPICHPCAMRPEMKAIVETNFQRFLDGV